MVNSTEPLVALLTNARERLAKAERSVENLRLEVSLYEKALAAVSGGMAVRKQQVTTRKKRGLSDSWQDVLAWIGNQAPAPDTEQIWQFVENELLGIQRPTLRSQLSIYTGQGLLERAEGGYRVTETGRMAAKDGFERRAAKSANADDLDGL